MNLKTESVMPQVLSIMLRVASVNEPMAIWSETAPRANRGFFFIDVFQKVGEQKAFPTD
jgi:hypothetical protein